MCTTLGHMTGLKVPQLHVGLEVLVGYPPDAVVGVAILPGTQACHCPLSSPRALDLACQWAQVILCRCKACIKGLDPLNV